MIEIPFPSNLGTFANTLFVSNSLIQDIQPLNGLPVLEFSKTYYSNSSNPYYQNPKNNITIVNTRFINNNDKAATSIVFTDITSGGY